MSSVRRISGLSCSISRGDRSDESLHLDLVDDRGEHPLPRTEARARQHLDDHPLPVLPGLVAEADRRRLASAPELFGHDRRVEVEGIHRVGHLGARVLRRTSTLVMMPSTQPTMALMMTSQIRRVRVLSTT